MEALGLLGRVEEAYVVKGKKVVHLDLSKQVPTEETVAMLLGPTGNLRAPTMRVGKTLLVGFNEHVFRKVLG